ncbi:Holliday junction branch migration protein RuvA [Candidatus Poribacteria bacterium]|nr:Holliday junction branch migration protein RuvA [Candidatus Poribacteria bacterium]
MIAYVSGTLEETEEDAVVIDVQGVGYEVFVPQRVLNELPPVGGSVKLYTHDNIREDDHTLYGFSTREERALFRMMIAVSGIGARTGLSLLSILGHDDFIRAVQEGDVVAISRAQGVGKKTAQRVILDLQNKVGALQPLSLGGQAIGTVAGDAMQALIALGETEIRAEQAVRTAQQELGEDAQLEQLIAAALRTMHAWRQQFGNA